MDLVQTVKKQGSRGGRGDFKWEDVKQDNHRENYLGHSVMAPIGRWQQGRDLNWYSKNDGSKSEAEARAEEIKKVKQAEEAARRAALGLPPIDENANLIEVQNNKLEENPSRENITEKDHRNRDKGKHRRHRSKDRYNRRDRDRGGDRDGEKDGERERYRERERERHAKKWDSDRPSHRRRRSYSRERSPRYNRSRSPYSRNHRSEYYDEHKSRTHEKNYYRRNDDGDNDGYRHPRKRRESH